MLHYNPLEPINRWSIFRATRGYIIYPAASEFGGMRDVTYAFNTLEEAMNFIRSEFEKNPQVPKP